MALFHQPTSFYMYMVSEDPSLNLSSSSYSVLSGVVPLVEIAGFTPFLLQLLALRLSTRLVSEHLPASNQSSLSPLPFASFRSS